MTSAEIGGENVLTPEWDSVEGRNKMNMLREEFLQWCGCKKVSAKQKPVNVNDLIKFAPYYVAVPTGCNVPLKDDFHPAVNDNDNDSDEDSDEEENDDIDPIESDNKDSDSEENNSDYDLTWRIFYWFFGFVDIHSCSIESLFFGNGQYITLFLLSSSYS